MADRSVQLTRMAVSNFKCASVLREPSDSDTITTFNAMDYHRSGKYLVTTGDAGSVCVFDALRAKLLTRVFSKKTGTKHAKYTHAEAGILYVGSDDGKDGTDDAVIHYTDLEKNRLVRTFKGHASPIVNVSKIHATADTFMTCDESAHMYMWDLRGPKPIGHMTIKRTAGSERLSVANDVSGSIFATAESGGMIRLYDASAAWEGPFYARDVSNILRRECGENTRIESIHVSPNEDQAGDILLGTNKDHIVSVNPEDLGFHCVLKRKKKTPNALPIAISPDGNFVVAASEAKFELPKTYKECGGGEKPPMVYEMMVWSLKRKKENMKPIARWAGTSLLPVRTLQWNPKYASFASGCCALKFFLPPAGF